MAKQEAVIKNWEVLRWFGGKVILHGIIVSHPKFAPGAEIQTIDFVNHKCETLNTTYTLEG